MAAHGFEPRTLRVWTACSSQLSYAAIFIWSWWPGLNWWPYPYQGYALPTELHQRPNWIWLRGLDLNQRPSGYEPDELPTAPPRDESWWRGLDSNQRSETRQIYSLLPLATREPLHILELAIGLEPTTCWLQVSCSTCWAMPALASDKWYSTLCLTICQQYFYLFFRFFSKSFKSRNTKEQLQQV